MSQYPHPYGDSPYGNLPYQNPSQPPVHQNSGGHIAVAWVVTVLTFLYTLPWAIAATRHKRNTGMIALLNVLTGWSGVGWVISLVLACLSDPPPTVVVHHHTHQLPSAPPPALGTGRGAGWEPQGYGGQVHSAPSASPYDYQPLPQANRLSGPYDPQPQQHAFGMGSVDPFSTYPQVSAPPPVAPPPSAASSTSAPSAARPSAASSSSPPITDPDTQGRP